MSGNSKRGLNNLKHGAFAKTAILPGEDPAEFQSLCDDVFQELQPTGALEEDVVRSIAKLVWRKQRLFAFRPKNLEPHSYQDPLDDALATYELALNGGSSPPDQAAVDKRVEEIRRERREEAAAKGEIEQLPAVDMETFERELALEAKLDMMIERNLKRLMQIKATKDMIGFRAQEQLGRPAIEGPQVTK